MTTPTPTPSPEQPPIQSAPPLATGARKVPTKKIRLSVLFLVLLALVGLYVWNGRQTQQSDQLTAVTPAPTVSATPKNSLPLLAYAGADQEIIIRNLDTAKEEKVIPAPDRALDCHGQVGGCVRSVSMAANGSIVATDNFKSGDKVGIAYVDLKSADKKAVFLTEAGGPLVSPDGSHIAYVTLDSTSLISTAKVIRVADGKVTEVAGSTNSVSNYPPRPSQWVNSSTLLLLGGPVGSLYLANASTGVMKEVKVPDAGFRPISEAVVAPQGNLLLVGYSWNQGYGVATVRIDGTGFKSIVPVTVSPWAGSGYSPAAWAPDGKQAAFVDFYAPETVASGTQTHTKLRIVRADGKELKVLSHEFNAHGEVCWLTTAKEEMIIGSVLVGAAWELVSIDNAGGNRKVISTSAGSFSCTK